MAQSQDKEVPIPIENFNEGGIADSKWSGIPNSLYRFVGFDPHSAPGILRTAQKMTKNSGIVVTEFCKARLASSNGCNYWGSSESGKIWQCDDNGVWTLVYTIVPAAGEAKILEMYEFLGTIYISTQSRLHKIVAADAIGASEWTANIVLNFGTFTNADLDFHPMFELNQVMYIGDGSLIAQVGDTGVFTADALDINPPLRVKCFGKIGVDLLIGTYISDNVTQTLIYRWDTVSDSWTVSDPIHEVGINAFFIADNFVYAQCGYQGNIYMYDGEKLNLWKKIPGDYSPTKQSTIYPQAVGNVENQILFGVSNVQGNPSDLGIFRIARNSIIYPYILDLPYPISEKSAGALILSNIEVGGLLVAGYDIYSSWRRKATVTISIATPGVVTYSAHGLTDGDAISFATTGALPTGITAGTIYFIRSIDTNTFHLYDTSAHAIAGGATGRVDTSGTQSGVHTASHVGIDKLDWSNKLNGAFFESRIITGDREKFTNFSKFIAAYALLPSATAISIAYSKNYGAYTETTEVTDTDRNVVVSDSEGVEATTLQLRVTITASGNDAPEIESTAVFYR